MTHARRIGCVLLLALASISGVSLSSGFAQSPVEPARTGYGDPAMPLTDENRRFFERFKVAVANDDRSWIADNVHYPIGVRLGGKRVDVGNRNEFLAHYDEIINQRVRDAVLGQTFETLFKNWRGIMIGRGQVWLDEVGVARPCRDITPPNSKPGDIVTCNDPGQPPDGPFRMVIRAINNDPPE